MNAKEIQVTVVEAQDVSEFDSRAQLMSELSLVQVRVPVYMFNPEHVVKKSGSAKRMAAQRARQASNGLISSPVPTWLVEQVKDIGGWNPDGHPNSPTYGHLKLPHLN